MNLGKLTNIVRGVIKSRKDKTNKITQLAMAINGTYVEDTTYVDDRIQWVFTKNEDDLSVQHSNISKAVEKINSLESENVALFLTER
jgi:protein-tyrosine phosphatase